MPDSTASTLTPAMGPTSGAAAPQLDTAHFRRVLGRYPSGVCVITAVGPDGVPVGMTVSSFTSVSLEPPLVAFLPAKQSRVYAVIASVRRFAVNILAGDQADTSRQFASPVQDRFESLEWRPSPLGSPVLEEALAWIDCRIDSVVEAGDHDIVVGAVDSLDVQRFEAPLISFQGGYGRFSSVSMVADTDDGLAAHLRLADLARPKLEAITKAFGVQTAASVLVGSEVIQLAWVSTEDTDLATNMIGLRLPFTAPFGLLFAAWTSEPMRTQWLGRHADSDDATVRALLHGTERARHQGWIDVPDHAKLREVEASIARLAVDGRLPETVRELDAHVEEYAHAYAALPDEQPRGVAVPVFDHAGGVALALSVQQLPAMDAETLGMCRASLMAAADELTRALHGKAPERS